MKSKEFSQKCLTNKSKTAILKIFTAMGLLVYHEKGFDGKKRERILHCRESAAGGRAAHTLCANGFVRSITKRNFLSSYRRISCVKGKDIQANIICCVSVMRKHDF